MTATRVLHILLANSQLAELSGTHTNVASNRRIPPKFLVGASHMHLSQALAVGSCGCVCVCVWQSTAGHSATCSIREEQAKPNARAKNETDKPPPTTMAITWGDIPRLFCSILLPPLGVFFQVGCTSDLAINILLTLLGYAVTVVLLLLFCVADSVSWLFRLVSQVHPRHHPRRVHPREGVRKFQKRPSRMVMMKRGALGATGS